LQIVAYLRIALALRNLSIAKLGILRIDAERKLFHVLFGLLNQMGLL
jgi:hypothetical protein